ncbi:M23 family metallopeptidase [Alkalihalobacillus sp. NPDC078783]
MGFSQEGMSKVHSKGEYKHPVTGATRYRTGDDFVGEEGTEILSNVAGTVEFASFGEYGTGYGGYGNVVSVKDSSDKLHLFAHLSNVDVAEGEEVKVGDVLGVIGSSGNSTGRHLRYEVRN